MSQAYRGGMTFGGPALIKYICMCLFGEQWKQAPGIDRMVPLRLISTMTLQSKKSEEKGQSLFQDLHFKPLRSRHGGNLKKHLDLVVKQRNVFPSTPPTLPVQPPPSSVYHRVSDTQSNMKGCAHVSLLSDEEKWHLWNHLCHLHHFCNKPPSRLSSSPTKHC